MTCFKPRIAVTYFTCADHFNLLMLSAQVLNSTLPEADIFVYDDASVGSMTHEMVEKVREQGMIYIPTTFNRRGNLLGQDSLLGMSQCWRDIAEEYEIIVKIDADTFLLKPDWLKTWYNHYPDAMMAGATSPDTPFYPQGPCYAMRTKIIKHLYEDIREFPAWYACWEDYEIGYRIARLAERLTDHPAALSIYRLRHQHDLIATKPIPFTPANVQTLAKASIYSVDFFGDTRPKEQVTQDKATYMAAFAEFFFRTNQLKGEPNVTTDSDTSDSLQN